MASNVSPVTPLGTFQYVNPSFYSDFDYIDMDATTFPFAMNNSIFGMGGVPFAGSGGVFGDNKSYYDNMKQQQQFYNQYYVDQQKLQRNADLQINGAMEAIQETAANLKDKIKQNEQDQIKDAYNKFVSAVRSAYGEGSEEEINSRAMSLYQRMTGKGLVEDLRENSHSSLIQGFLQTVTLGAFYRKSAEDNIAEITNQEVPTGEKTEQNVGRAVGVATVGTAAYAGVKALSGKTGAIATALQKVFKGKAGIVGLAAAGVAAALTFLTGKIST